MYWADGERAPRIIDKHGKPVSIRVPPGWHFRNLLLPRNDVLPAGGEVLPANALIVANKAGLTGVLAPNGEVMVAPEYQRIDIIDSHRLRLSKDNPVEFREDSFVFDGFTNRVLSSNRQEKTEPDVEPLLFSDHWRSLKFSAKQWRICESDRILIQLPENGFDSNEWNNPRSMTRVSLFGQFLRDYDFIGMSRKQVWKLLGAGNEIGDRTSYSLIFRSCSFGGQPHISVRYDKNDKVDAWTISQNSIEQNDSAWTTQNVVTKKLRPLNNSDLKDLQPKPVRKP